ncbi:SDR family NAD(P)-dependent oxidoreductase [Synechococcus sp. MU1643]|uniref:SDR family NAD(P)-dependent oxidoreductase n=1 Tax=Synechococcus sp. MU1643 TaxID=2508349 RepID=UPI001CF80C1F|nr:SDR family NAD(P)-dependent oxidoreductase [Synechococcus sp. MU1643]MCB4427812.1 SDR family NAD(P)-dependent oxidoreductase [Synechococcus sp. MU1643]
MTTAEQRRVLITGVSSGIGLEAAKILLTRGDALTIVCRNAERAELTRKALSDSVDTCIADLADLASVAKAIEQLRYHEMPFDALVLNAGLQYAGYSSPRWSAQGIELTFAVNHLAHQLLAEGLMEQTKAIVITASEVHNPATGGGRVGQPAGLGALQGLRQGPGASMVDGESPFNADKAYKDSKLCNLLMALQIHQQHEDLPVVAWSPGLVIPRTSEGFFRNSRQANPLGQALFGFVARDVLRLTESVERAGELLVKLINEQLHQPGFSYWSNGLLGPGRHHFKPTEPSEEANDSEKATMLWTLSRELINSVLTPSDRLSK